MVYIALLRAINVGGHNVKMDALRALFEELGFSNVRSFIQSGNVFFESNETDRAKLTREIEEHLEQSLGYMVPTMLRTVEDIERIFELDPFKGIEVTDDIRLMILFLSQPVPKDITLPLTSDKKEIEILSATENEAFVVLHIAQPGKVPEVTKFIEKTLGSKSTGRFYHTSEKLLAAAKG